MLSLDVLRVLTKPTVFESFARDIQTRIAGIHDQSVQQHCVKVSEALDCVRRFLQVNINKIDVMETNARKLAFALARVYICCLLAEHTQHCHNKDDTEAENRLSATLEYWLQKRLFI